MRFEHLVARLFDFYMLGCMTAIAFGMFSKERRREAILQPLIYMLVIGLFEWRLHGRAHEFGFWWYGINFLADAWIVFTSFGIKAFSSKYVAAFGVLACFVDLGYFLSAARGQPLPGIGYYSLSETFESLQVLSMIIWSGPVIPILAMICGVGVKLTKKASKWTQHRLAHQD